MGVIRVLNIRQGDASTAWPDTQAERATEEGKAETLVARHTFEDVMRKNFLAYKVDARGKPGDQIREFDPAVKEIVVIAPLAGGCL